MKLRNIIILMIINLLLVGLTACSSNSDYTLDFTGDLNATAHLPFETLSELVEGSDHILYGQLIENIIFGDSYEYIFRVDQQLKGKTHNSQISVFASEGFTSEFTENKFFLFLTSFDSEYYDEPYYTTVIQPIAIEQEKAVVKPFKDVSLKQLIKDVERSPKINTFREKNKNRVIQEAKSIDELIEKSDYILHLQPKNIELENPRVKLVSFELIHKYKGDDRILNRTAISLPSFVNENEEYLVFYKFINPSEVSENPSLTLSTREGSVIEVKDNEKWRAAIEALDKISN